MVTATTDLIEDWIMMRAMFQKQVKMLEAGNPSSGSKATVARLKTCIAELNVLLKEHARDSRIVTAKS